MKQMHSVRFIIVFSSKGFYKICDVNLLVSSLNENASLVEINTSNVSE